MHSSVILNRPDKVVLVLGGLAVFYGLLLSADFKAVGWRKGVFWEGSGAALLLTAVSRDLSQYALYFPPALITGMVLYLFARTLAPGEEPLITRFARKMTDNISPEIILYTRRVTWMWTLLLSAILIECILLPVFASLEIWSLFTNFLNYIIMGVFFAAEYIYRLYRFGRRYSFRSFIRKMMQVSLK